MILLDMNVVSELMCPLPAAALDGDTNPATPVHIHHQRGRVALWSRAIAEGDTSNRLQDEVEGMLEAWLESNSCLVP